MHGDKHQAEKLNVFYWWTSLKAYFSKQFPNFFVAASTPTDGNLLGNSKSIGQQLQEIEQYFAMGAACAYSQIGFDVYTNLVYRSEEWLS